MLHPNKSRFHKNPGKNSCRLRSRGGRVVRAVYVQSQEERRGSLGLFLWKPQSAGIGSVVDMSRFDIAGTDVSWR